MTLAYLLLLTGLTISGVAIYYSVVGLTAIFAAASVPIIIMGSALEVGKLVCASWLKANWDRAPKLLKWYMVSAVAVLMLITSMGIFGFLSKAHSDQSLVSGDVTSKIAIYDEKIKIARDNIDANRKALKQMDEAVDQVMGRSNDEKGADKAVAIRKGQAKERARLQSEITAEQKTITQLNEERAPIAAEVRKVEAEVGPLKYIAAFVYGANPDSTMLEKAVTWVIIMIVVVFDPLAVIMLLAAQMTFAWHRGHDPLAEDDKFDEAREEVEDTGILAFVADVGEPPTEEEKSEEQFFETVKEQAKALDASQVTWPFATYTEPVEAKERFDLDQEFLSKVEKGEITFEGDKEIKIEEQTESDLDRWNKMIEAAEAEVAKTNAYDTIADRLARGESFVNSEGNEEVLAEQQQLEEEFLERFDENLKNQDTKILTMGIDPVERPGDYLPDHNPLSPPNLELKKKTYMTKDQTGSVVVKSIP